MKFNPLVSIVIPSYNREKWIGKAIESCISQSYKNIEIIISDNCSTDNSDAVINAYKKKDERILYFKNNKNIGMIPNFEKCFFELAKGEYIVNVSSDDYLTDLDFISKAIKIIEKYKNVKLVFGRCVIYNEYNKKFTRVKYPQYYNTEFRIGLQTFFDFPQYPYFGFNGCLINRQTMIENELHFTGRTCNDLETNLPIMLQGGNTGFINSDVHFTRIHDSNATGILLSSEKYINERLEMFEIISNKYIQKYGYDSKIDYWKKGLIQNDINNIGISFLLRNKVEYEKFISYVKNKYPDLFLNFIRSKKYIFSRFILVPIIKNKSLKKIAAKLFPQKTFFTNEYK